MQHCRRFVGPLLGGCLLLLAVSLSDGRSTSGNKYQRVKTGADSGQSSRSGESSASSSSSSGHGGSVVDQYRPPSSLAETHDDRDDSSAGVPTFDDSLPRQVEVPLQDPVYLHCRVRNQGRYQVAWVRQRDGALLSVDGATVTKDPRFQVSHKESDNDWILIIRYAKRNDAGYYECQVSTTPAQRFNSFLRVLEPTPAPTAAPETTVPWAATQADEAHDGLVLKGPKTDAEIAGKGSVVHGDPINLSCSVTLGNAQTHDYVTWTLNGSAIDLTNVKKYQSKKLRRGLTVVHTLHVAAATDRDTGTYACKPEHSPAQSMLIQVNGAYTVRSGISWLWLVLGVMLMSWR